MLNPLADPQARLVVAHRGNRVGAPENTLEALQQAADLGADALEFDVRCTRDGELVVIHDAELDRTTSGHGPVRSFSLAELRTLDAGARSPHSQGARHLIPTLEEVLERFRKIPLVIEVKEMAAAEDTERLVRKFNAQERVLVGSAENAVVERFYRSGLLSCASMNDALLLIPFALLGLAPPTPRYNVLSVTPRFHGLPIPVTQMAQSARRAGVPTQVWTVNDAEAAQRLWLGGVAAIVTDDPAAILRARPS
jgi:glycerophosphoryl diester phosphodiesterase